MGDLQVLAIQRLSPADVKKIEGVDSRIELVNAGGWFDGEIRATWPAFTSNRYLGPEANGVGTKDERDQLLANAEVILGGFPFPLDLRARSPRLRWFHQRPAGASNLLKSDLWGSDVTVTTSRGFGNTLPIAEYVIGSILYFAKGFQVTRRERQEQAFSHRDYRPQLLDGKTLCVVGAGGIGLDVGRLAAAMGMRVVGTRRRPPAGDELPAGFVKVGPPEDLLPLLAESQYVAVCAQWTPETTNLINADAFAAMLPESVLVNIARGEIVDEAALVDALASGRLRGAALDVYVGEFEAPPRAELWDDDRVLVTPHTSAMSDDDRHRAIDIFCANLAAYLADQPLENVIDWEAGY